MEAHARNIAKPVAPPDDGGGANRKTRKVRLAASGAVLAALAAVSCPLIMLLLSLGVGTAWIGSLPMLDPYRPFLFALVAASLAYGYYLAYWKPRNASVESDAQASPDGLVKLSLWAATAFVAASVAFDLASALFEIH